MAIKTLNKTLKYKNILNRLISRNDHLVQMFNLQDTTLVYELFNNDEMWFNEYGIYKNEVIEFAKKLNFLSINNAIIELRDYSYEQFRLKLLIERYDSRQLVIDYIFRNEIVTKDYNTYKEIIKNSERRKYRVY